MAPTHAEQLESARMIRDSVAAMFPAAGSLARVRELRFRSLGHDPQTYREMCAMGWSGLRTLPELGGSGLQMTELCALAQGLGAALVPEPIVTTAVLAPLLAHGAEDLLPAVLAGEVLVTAAWAERANGLGDDPRIQYRDGRVTGTKRFVPSAGAQIFVVATAQGPVLVRRDDPGVRIQEHFMQDGGVLAEVRFDAAAGRLLHGDLNAVMLELTLANAAMLQGVMDRMLEITLEYLTTRKQFGRAIGSFQVLQHRMVDLRMEQELARAVLAETVAAFDNATDHRTRASAVSRAAARLSHASITAAKHAIQQHGAIGMTDECDIGLYARKVLALYNRFGSASKHRQRYMALNPRRQASTRTVADVDLATLPADYNDWPDDAFRAHVQHWVERNYPAELRHPLERLHRRDTKVWYDRLVERGWLAPGWPREWGGMGLSPAKQVIFQDVLARHGCARFSDHGVNQLGPLIMNYGSAEQKAFFLPKIMTGEHIWCQGYSEPNSGSDLASLRTEAVLDGDTWVINGQKIWTTLATDANWIYLLVRTDKSGKKQSGISFMLVPMNTPGITVRPILTIGMTPEFCEVFFDNVRVPRNSLVGEINQGWQMAKALLGFERLFVGSPPQSANTLAQLDTLAHDLELWDDTEFRDEYARLVLELRDHESLYQLFVDQVCRGEELGADISMLKIHQTELYQRITQAAIDFGGEYAALRRSPAEETSVTPAALWIQARVTTIYGGTSEIQRNILAKNVLHLPEGA